MPNAGAPIKITVDDKAFKDQFSKLINRTQNKEGFFRNWVIPIMYKDFADHFSKESGPNGSWQPLKKSTMFSRKGNVTKYHPENKAQKILQDSGLMRMSVTVPGAADNVMNVGPGFALVGTNKRQAATHQFGRGAIPQRQFLWMSKDALDRILKQLKVWILGEAQ